MIDKTRPVIFSAHGVSEKIKQRAQELKLNVIDATCPLVNAVHQKIKKLEKDNAIEVLAASIVLLSIFPVFSGMFRLSYLFKIVFFHKFAP